MKCAKCGEELNERWAVCPFCGTEVPKTPLSVSDALKDIVDHYGPSIFREENCVRLERLMSDWPDTLADDRDIIKLLQIKNIPDRLSSALEMPEAERLPVVQQSTSLLSDKFGINGESAIKMISLVTDAIGLKVEGVVAGSGNGTVKQDRSGDIQQKRNRHFCTKDRQRISDQDTTGQNVHKHPDPGRKDNRTEGRRIQEGGRCKDYQL